MALVHWFIKSEFEGGSSPQRKQIPLHAANMKEAYENMKILLGKI